MEVFDGKLMGARIRKRRERLGLTQEDMGSKLHISRESYNQIENSRRALKDRDVVAIAETLHTSTDYILRGIKTENLSVSKATGLSDAAISSLREIKKNTVHQDKKPASAEIGKDYLYALNMLLTTPEGRDVLEYICHYLITDFDSASYFIEEVHVDEYGNLDGYHESNNHPIERLYFERAVMGHGKGIEIDCKMMSYALLQAINSRLKEMRNSILAKEGTSYAERRKAEEKEFAEDNRESEADELKAIEEWENDMKRQEE